MADINNFTFTGRLGSDAIYKTLASGKGLLECSVANNTGFGDYAKTNWLKVKMWGDRGSKVAQFLKKGSLIGGAGEVTQETWTGKDGVEHTDLIVTCMNVQILAGAKADKSEPEPSDEAVF